MDPYTDLAAAAAIVRIGLDRTRNCISQTSDLHLRAAALRTLHDPQNPSAGTLASLATLLRTISFDLLVKGTPSPAALTNEQITNIVDLLDEAQAYVEDSAGERIRRALQALAPHLSPTPAAPGAHPPPRQHLSAAQQLDLASEFRVPVPTTTGYSEIVVKRLRAGINRWAVTDGATTGLRVWTGTAGWQPVTDVGTTVAYPYTLDEALTVAHDVAEREAADYNTKVAKLWPTKTP